MLCAQVKPVSLRRQRRTASVDVYASSGYADCIERGAVPTLSGVEGQGLCLQHALCSSEPASLLIPSGKQAASPSSTT